MIGEKVSSGLSHWDGALNGGGTGGHCGNWDPGQEVAIDTLSDKLASPEFFLRGPSP